MQSVMGMGVPVFVSYSVTAFFAFVFLGWSLRVQHRMRRALLFSFVVYVFGALGGFWH